jgi:hypothetical protein
MQGAGGPELLVLVLVIYFMYDTGRGGVCPGSQCPPPVCLCAYVLTVDAYRVCAWLRA